MAEIDAGLRVDAARNRTRILAAARDLFATHGPNVPMETIAQHADVGIGTLYRRFPHRSDLVCAVAVELWRQIAIEAKRAEAEEVDAFAALGRYMHRARYPDQRGHATDRRLTRSFGIRSGSL